jgi:hypothetical protein
MKLADVAFWHRAYVTSGSKVDRNRTGFRLRVAPDGRRRDPRAHVSNGS